MAFAGGGAAGRAHLPPQAEAALAELHRAARRSRRSARPSTRPMKAPRLAATSGLSTTSSFSCSWAWRRRRGNAAPRARAGARCDQARRAATENWSPSFLAVLADQGAAKRHRRDCSRDVSRPHPMHRLLQGDVGSGKTVVAWAACELACASGYQAAIMAPTELLAEQHARTLLPWAKAHRALASFAHRFPRRVPRANRSWRCWRRASSTSSWARTRSSPSASPLRVWAWW